jgi:thiamine biosynthesis lipoprotein
MVKVFDPPEFAVDVRIEVDALLRQINDLMSTYLESSELSRFNQSSSTDWFDVSKETVSVVAFARELSQRTDGAFDVTVGPLVNAWSFGPDPRTRTVPDAETLRTLREQVGYQHLSVRSEPPALKKAIPELKVDLSAIAKGYAVDRVVELLNELGAPNVFVEIGGEVRTSGSKAGTWWKVGIQVPDMAHDAVLIAHSLNTGSGADRAMATSGDYRNFFEADGVRYSHTIDPRTGQPIKHALASVSVLAESCMAADAWATAINVLGPEAGRQAAMREGLSALLIERQSNRFVLTGTGALAKYADDTSKESRASGEQRGDTNPLLIVPVLTACAFGIVLVAMAVGVIFGRRAISGSCGGLANARNEDGSVSCSLCSNPSDACKELRERMNHDNRQPQEEVRGA